MNSIYISFENEEEEKEFPEELIKKYLAEIFKYFKIDKVEISCSFVSDETIAKLNKDYRNIEGPTDILSFVQMDSNDEEGSTTFVQVVEKAEKRVLGDLIISIDSLKRNCEYFNIEGSEELFRLLTHGVLHLTGEDHKTNNSDEPMLIRQEMVVSHFKGRIF